MFKFLRRDLSLVLAAAAVFVALSYAIGSKSEEALPKPTESQVAFLDAESAPKKQTAPARIWKEYVFEKTLGLDPPSVKKPASLRVGNGGEIYLLDWNDLLVKRFSTDGKLLQTFGQQSSTGESAFVNPTALSVRPDGELWVSDPRQATVKRYRPDGKTQEFKPQIMASRIAVVGDVLVTLAPAKDDSVFEIYDLSGNRLETFGKLIRDQGNKGIMLDGNVVGDDSSRGFVYASYTVPVIAGYSVDGTQRFMVQPIEAGPPPTALNIGEKQKANPNAITLTRSLSIDGDHLYVLCGATVRGVGNKGGLVMDVYDKQDGVYLYSFKLPLACKEAVVRGDYIYALPRGGSLRVWRFRQSA